MATKNARPGTTKADLIDQVYRRHGALTRNEAAEVVDTIFSSMKASLGDGVPIRIANFGVFEVRPRPERRGVNPVDGSEITISASRGLSFRPARRLKSLVAPIEDD